MSKLTKVADAEDVAPAKTFALSETVFTTSEAAAYLRISRGYLYRLIERGDLKPFHVGTRTLVTGAELSRYVAAQVKAAS